MPAFYVKAFTSVLASLGGGNSNSDYWASSFRSSQPVDLLSNAPSTQHQGESWQDSRSVRSYNADYPSSINDPESELVKGKKKGYPQLPLTITYDNYGSQPSQHEVQGPPSAFSSVREGPSQIIARRFEMPPYPTGDMMPGPSRRINPSRQNIQGSQRAQSTFSSAPDSVMHTVATRSATLPYPIGDMIPDFSRLRSSRQEIHKPRPEYPLPKSIGEDAATYGPYGPQFAAPEVTAFLDRWSHEDFDTYADDNASIRSGSPMTPSEASLPGSESVQARKISSPTIMSDQPGFDESKWPMPGSGLHSVSPRSGNDSFNTLNPTLPTSDEANVHAKAPTFDITKGIIVSRLSTFVG